MTNRKPIIGITMGDPAGCGPEVTVKALSRREIYEKCGPLVIGDVRVMRQALLLASHPEIQIREIANVSQSRNEYGTIDVLHLNLVDMDKLKFGEVSAMCGNAAFQCVKRVIELAMEKRIDATVTNALCKEAINSAGHNYSGHTEIYAEFTHTPTYAMMLAHHDLRVIHVSTHVSLREACERVKRERVLKVIRLADETCRQLGIKLPQIGVAGLNPHAGENGMFGREVLPHVSPILLRKTPEPLRKTLNSCVKL